ncbi:MAG: hypothetical protein ACREH8_19050, partial [Opitutaceae bacterium]
VHGCDDFILFLFSSLSLSFSFVSGLRLGKEREKRKSQRTVALVAASGRGAKSPVSSSSTLIYMSPAENPVGRRRCLRAPSPTGKD